MKCHSEEWGIAVVCLLVWAAYVAVMLSIFVWGH